MVIREYPLPHLFLLLKRDCWKIWNNGGTHRHPQDFLPTLTATIATSLKGLPGREGSFGESGPVPSPSSRGTLLSYCPPAPPRARLPPPPATRVSGPRHGGRRGRRMADVRVSAASLTETVKGQEQCLGQPPAPASPSPRGPGPPTRPPATASRDQTSCISWGVGRS